MKDSWKFKLAQIAVIESENITTGDKVEVLKILIDREGLALFVESEEEKKNK